VLIKKHIYVAYEVKMQLRIMVLDYEQHSFVISGFCREVNKKCSLLGLTLENGTNRLSRNVDNELPLNAAK
jgi:hypothetical protein